MTTQEREHARIAWGKIAPGYDKANTPAQMRIANEGLHRAGLRAGMQFLDVTFREITHYGSPRPALASAAES